MPKPLYKNEAEFAQLFWEELQWRKHPDLMAWHTPNEGKRSFAYGKSLKKEGMTAGVLDYIFILPNGKIAFLELKHGYNKLTESQIDFILDLASHPSNPPYAVAYSLQECFDFLKIHGGLK